MAHIFDIAQQVKVSKEPSYVSGRKVSDDLRFPETPVFQGFSTPTRLEGDIRDLEVDGEIPKEINGTFYRIQPDHRFPPLFEDDIHFNGDGSVTAIRIENGHANFKQRYVHTDRYHQESASSKSLFGRYRNPFTDNEAVKGIIRTAANTNITFWRGILLAAKEDGPAFAMDPVTLETIGRYDFDGQVLAPTMTAHPKLDPETGEMICFAYEAGGNGNDGSRDIVVYTIDADGVKTEECWYKAPFCGMIHDCGISKNWIVLPMTPLKCSLDRMRRGGNHWAWDPDEDQLFGLVPRRGGKPDDIIWFRANNAFHGHTAGCYEDESGHVIFDCTNADGNVFFFFPPESATSDPAQRQKLQSPTVRWVFDPSASKSEPPRVAPTETFPINGEFSRIDDRWITKPYTHFWQCQIDPSRPYDAPRCGPPAGGLFNCLGHFRWDTREKDVWWAGPRSTFQEPTFIPREGGAEGEGWIIALVNRLDEMRNDILLFDSLAVAAGPIAVLKLPLKLRLGLHGNFVDQRDVEAWKERRSSGEVTAVKAASRPLKWQEEVRMSNGANGHGH